MSKKLQTTRRHVLKGVAATGAAIAAAPYIGYAQAAEGPIRAGFQVHRTGIGASYGLWYSRAAEAATKIINNQGGINGRQLELVPEDDGTDPKRGAEVVEKFAKKLKCDVAFGTLFSHVVYGSAPRAGDLKIPYLVCSEGHHVASGKLNRYTLQPTITDVKSQVETMAPWVSKNLGKKVTMLFPDFAFGHDHRDYFSEAIARQGGKVIKKIAVPPAESSFTKYFPKIPKDTDVIYHVMVGPSVLTFVKELGQFYGKGARPEIFGFIDSLEAVSIKSPGLEFLEGTYFWEGHPRYYNKKVGQFEKQYRKAVGVDNNGASIRNSKEVSTYAHMFSAWEALFFLKRTMESAGYKTTKDRKKLIEAMEAVKETPYSIEAPSGKKIFNGKTHQAFGHQYISQVKRGRLKLTHITKIEDSFYPDEVDYTKQSL